MKKYLFFHFLTFTSFTAFCQNNEAMITIVGNPVDNINQVQYLNNYQENNPPPPEQQQFAPIQQNIEPSLENGFHMRFQLESPGSVERLSGVTSSSHASSSYSSGSGGGSGIRVKKHSVSMAQRTFNFKKKIKNWLPERKKKYHPTLCEKFR
ncbi:MAG TPA: hypothetical protein VF868_05815 [Bacteroidia bacterium]